MEIQFNTDVNSKKIANFVRWVIQDLEFGGFRKWVFREIWGGFGGGGDGDDA